MYLAVRSSGKETDTMNDACIFSSKFSMSRFRSLFLSLALPISLSFLRFPPIALRVAIVLNPEIKFQHFCFEIVCVCVKTKCDASINDKLARELTFCYVHWWENFSVIRSYGQAVWAAIHSLHWKFISVLFFSRHFLSFFFIFNLFPIKAGHLLVLFNCGVFLKYFCHQIFPKRSVPTPV